MTPDLRPLPRATARGMSTISEPCYVCDGDGEILDLSIGEDCAEFIPCPTCNGTGEIETEDCKERDE